MKNFCIIFVFLLFICNVNAGSINPAVYKTMSYQSYRNNYNNQVINKPMPYWQAQSNYATRNKVYTDYSKFNNAVNQSKYHNYYKRNY